MGASSILLRVDFAMTPGQRAAGNRNYEGDLVVGRARESLSGPAFETWCSDHSCPNSLLSKLAF